MITIEHPTVIATVGLPGSGKTTWADQQVNKDKTGKLVVVNRDHIRAMLRRPYPTAEELVTRVQYAAILSALASGCSAIVDDTNLNPEHLERLQSLALNEGASFVIVATFLFVPLETVLTRNRTRPAQQQVPEEDIRRMRDRWSKEWPQLSDEPSIPPHMVELNMQEPHD